MRILVIAAHPDDEVYGMGGTIAKLAKENEVYTLIVTEGCTSQYNGDSHIIQVKKDEALACNHLLGVRKVVFGELPDMKLDTIPHVEINLIIEKTIKKLKPEIVYTHHKGDVNKDHRLIYESTLVATRPVPGQTVKKLMSYQVPSSTEWAGIAVDESFIPSIYEDISIYANLKYEAIELYRTEIREFPHPRSIKRVKHWDENNGLNVGLLAAEAFCLIREIKN